MITVTRHVGPGDYSHVRHIILQVRHLSTKDVKQQFLGAIKAARVLGFRARSYFPSSAYAEDVNELNANNEDHQVEFVDVLPSFVELTVDGTSFTADELSAIILETWFAHGERFANGNFGKLSVEQLHSKYIDLKDM